MADWDGSLSLESAVVLPASRPLIHCHGREWTLAASPTPQVPTRHGGNALAESFAPSSKFFKFLFFFFFKHKPYPLPPPLFFRPMLSPKSLDRCVHDPRGVPGQDTAASRRRRTCGGGRRAAELASSTRRSCTRATGILDRCIAKGTKQTPGSPTLDRGQGLLSAGLEWRGGEAKLEPSQT